ncbi:MAG: Type 1 glutamine amidotransferase-like domain-containing protein [Nanoarchaeota archaeon]|nr:Type 1 glutamine amidotransferase-like domain-containing protein [Nanoarchaeota archaeon]
MGTIVIIGGGEIGNFETLPFDKRIVELARKKHPKALFIPTASGEPKGYIKNFNKVYGKKLGCKTDVLFLLNTKPTKKELREKILSSDLIYVGGGNTLKMMKIWKFLGIDKILKEAYKKGTILSGISAGGICWFEAGHSDSMSFYHPNNWDYIKVRGLGLLKGIHCPHFNGETRGIKRRKNFSNFMKKYSAVGIAIDNHCAMEFIDGKYKVLTAKKDRKTYRIFKKRSKIIIEEILKKNNYMPISPLYKK